ncbi:MAG: class I SAM-dependent methyltransferase [Acidimicrobiia bacterium]
MTADDGRLAHNRVIWALVNEQFTDADAAARWAEPDVRWGLFRTPELELGVLGSDATLRGARVAELGAGTSFLSAAVARAGARPVAVDLSRAQLATAQRCQAEFGVAFPLVEATGEAVPLRSGVFDLVVSEYGASPWCEPAAWLAEAARLLRPGGRLVFLTNSVLAGMCVPDEGGFAGEQLLRTPADLARVTWDGGGTEHHPSHGDWITMLRAAGFVVDALHELTAPPDAPMPDYYDIADVEWATKWPVEDLWVAIKP